MDPWTDTRSSPIGDLRAMAEQYRSVNGLEPQTMMVSKHTANELRFAVEKVLSRSWDRISIWPMWLRRLLAFGRRMRRRARWAAIRWA